MKLQIDNCFECPFTETVEEYNCYGQVIMGVSDNTPVIPTWGDPLKIDCPLQGNELVITLKSDEPEQISHFDKCKQCEKNIPLHVDIWARSNRFCSELCVNLWMKFP